MSIIGCIETRIEQVYGVDHRYEFSIKVKENGEVHQSQIEVCEDDLVSRYDQMFDIAKHRLHEHIMMQRENNE